MNRIAPAAAVMVVAGCCTWLFLPLRASAHEAREIVGFQLNVGWEEEPAFAGFKNAVSVRVTASDRGVENLLMRVEILFGDKDSSQKIGPIELRRVAEDFGHHMTTTVIPTRPGRYTFHLTGNLGGHPLDEYFISGKSTFDDVLEARDVQFPVQDPSSGELGSKTDRAATRAIVAVEVARNTSREAALTRILSFAGSGAGMVGLVLASVALRRASRQ